jgi:hypothetical protein
MAGIKTLPPELRIRRRRNGVVYYLLTQTDGTEVSLACGKAEALQRWITMRESEVISAPADPLRRASPGVRSLHATARGYPFPLHQDGRAFVTHCIFTASGNPSIVDAGTAQAYIEWHVRTHRSGDCDREIRLFRHIWRFTVKINVLVAQCPWSTITLRKSRTTAEVADIIHMFASPALRESMAHIRGGGTAESSGSCIRALEPDLLAAKMSAVAALRASWRRDLVAPTFKTCAGGLVVLASSGLAPVLWPPGRIDFPRRRS